MRGAAYLSSFLWTVYASSSQRQNGTCVSVVYWSFMSHVPEAWERESAVHTSLPSVGFAATTVQHGSNMPWGRHCHESINATLGWSEVKAAIAQLRLARHVVAFTLVHHPAILHRRVNDGLTPNPQCTAAASSRESRMYGAVLPKTNSSACAMLWTDMMETFDWIGTSDNIGSTLAMLRNALGLEERIATRLKRAPGLSHRIQQTLGQWLPPEDLHLRRLLYAQDMQWYWKATMHPCTHGGKYRLANSSRLPYELPPHILAAATRKDLMSPPLGLACELRIHFKTRQRIPNEYRWTLPPKTAAACRAQVKAPPPPAEETFQPLSASTPAARCEALRGRNLLMVGPSLHFENFLSTVFLLNGSFNEEQLLPMVSRNSTSQGVSTTARVCDGAVSVDFIWNDFLWDGNCSERRSSGTHMCAFPGRVMRFMKAAEDARPGVLVLSAGAHPLEVTMREHILYDLASWIQGLTWHPTVVFTNVAAGHDHCGSRTTKPLTVPPMFGATSVKYGWNHYEASGFDHFEVLETLLPRRVHFIDAYTIGRMRIDRHREFYAGRFGKHEDCLHYCIPGPPDEWNALMLEMLR